MLRMYIQYKMTIHALPGHFGRAPLGVDLSEPFWRPPAILSSCGTRRRTNISRHVIGDQLSHRMTLLSPLY